ncbi:MAG: hypothetical protein Q8R89_04820, partial [Desulfomicrobium sp.]|nr:hypothetical protein [Desulfomicrobium sp.]
YFFHAFRPCALIPFVKMQNLLFYMIIYKNIYKNGIIARATYPVIADFTNISRTVLENSVELSGTDPGS